MVVDVPLSGQVTYGEAVEKRPDPPPPVYDVDLMNDEQEEDILGIPVPTTRSNSPSKKLILNQWLASHSQKQDRLVL